MNANFGQSSSNQENYSKPPDNKKSGRPTSNSVPCAFLRNNTTKNVSFKRTIYNSNKSNIEKFCNSLSSIDWLNVTTGRTIDECTDLFTEIFTNIAKQCMPFKVVTVRSKDVHWLTSEIRELITHTKKKGIDSIVEPSGVN